LQDFSSTVYLTNFFQKNMKHKLILTALTALCLFTLTGCMIETVDQYGNLITTPTVTPTPSASIQSEDIKIGTGAEAKVGDTVSVHYVGTLTDGTKFDSSRDRNTPYQFTIGSGSVIQGWNEGVPGMKVGGIRRLTIPPELGYGSNAQAKIPANSTLIFEIELLAIVK